MITEPAILSATVASTNVTCFGAGNGTITVSAPLGGYGTYQYSINGGTTWQGTGSFTGLAPATYDVRIRDAVYTSCVITLNGALVITQPPVLAATVASTNVTCFGANDGTITITSPTGGYGTYEYTVNGGTTWQASGAFTALTPGFYNVQIRDAANTGCVIILNGSLRITEPPVLSAFVARTNVTCFGANDGTITITSPTGGYGTYEYSINGGTTWQASGNFTALAPATYNVHDPRCGTDSMCHNPQRSTGDNRAGSSYCHGGQYQRNMLRCQRRNNNNICSQQVVMDHTATVSTAEQHGRDRVPLQVLLLTPIT